MSNKVTLRDRIAGIINSVRGPFSLKGGGEVNPMEPITKRERAKRDRKRAFTSESRRRNRPVKKNRPTPKPGCQRYP